MGLFNNPAMQTMLSSVWASEIIIQDSEIPEDTGIQYLWDGNPGNVVSDKMIKTINHTVPLQCNAQQWAGYVTLEMPFDEGHITFPCGTER